MLTFIERLVGSGHTVDHSSPGKVKTDIFGSYAACFVI